MMYKSTFAVMALSMLVSACATESKLVTNAEPVDSLVVDTNPPAGVSTPVPALGEAKPVEIKVAREQLGGQLALAPDFYHCMVNWTGAMQTSLTPWTGAIKQCDTRGSGK